MKRLLLLGGSSQQLVAIETAKNLGYYTILCDYLNDNPGQYMADKFYLASTTDKELILDIAKKENIDGILAYASDPAAPTAAYVAEKLNLPGNPYKSVDILCNKDKFRKFLEENNFCTPKAKGYSSIEAALDDFANEYFRFPVIVKPVDSSGSKGVGKIENISDDGDKLKEALFLSRSGRIIVEEFVDSFGYQIAGDGCSINGELVFRCFANDHFDLNCNNPFVPISASFPYNMPSYVHEKIHNTIQRAITLLKMDNCCYNFDIRIDENYNVYLMEIGPRNGGNYIPQLIQYTTGVNLVEVACKLAMGEDCYNIKMVNQEGFFAYYSIHSNEEGILKKINVLEQVEKRNIIEKHIKVNSGDRVFKYSGANTTLGILLMKFDSLEQMLDMMDNANTWIDIKLDR